MITEDLAPQEGLEIFFDFMWRDTEGYVYLPTQDPKTNEWKKKVYKWPEHKSFVIQHVLTANAQGLHVFFAPAIFSEPNPLKQHVKGTHVVWTEFDGNAPSEWPENDPQEGQEQGQDGLGAVPPPSLRVQSSYDGREHIYWALDSFADDVAWIDGVNRSISYTYRSDTSGWDAGQILRPPYTTNYKHDLPVTVIDHNEREYPTSTFRSLKPVMELVASSIDTESLPTVEGIIAKYSWDDEHFKMFMDPSIPEGKRSSALMRLGYFGAEAGMSDEEIYALLDNADARWGKFVKRTDRKKRLLDIVNRAKTKHPRATSELTFAGLLQQQEIDVNKRYVYGYQDFLNEEIKVEWAIEGLLEETGFGMLAAAPGVGKTQLAMQCAISMALGTKFIGFTIPRERRVVFFSLEMGPVALRHFLDTISRQYTKEQLAVLQRNLYIVPLGESIPVTRKESIQFVHSLLDEIKPDSIFIDSVIKLSSGSLEDAAAFKINEFYAGLRARYGCTVMVIHHNRKANSDNKKPTRLEDVYGSVYLTAEMSWVGLLWKDDEWGVSQIEMIPVKSRMAPPGPNLILARNHNLHFMQGERELTQEGLDNIMGMNSTPSLEEDGSDGSNKFNGGSSSRNVPEE